MVKDPLRPSYYKARNLRKYLYCKQNERLDQCSISKDKEDAGTFMISQNNISVKAIVPWLHAIT